MNDRRTDHFPLWIEVIMDSMDALVYVSDMKTHELLFLNKYGRDLFPDFAPGKKCHEVLQEGEGGPCSFCTNGRLVDARDVPAGTCRWELRNTKTGRWFDCRDQAIRWSDGRLVRLEIATDITDRKRNEEELRRVNNIQSLILDNSVVGIALVRNRIFEWVNPKLPEMLGLPLEEVQGSDTRIIYPSDEVYEEMGHEAYCALSKGEWFDFEIAMPHANGTSFAGRVLGKAIDPNHPQDGSIWIFESITDRKRSEDERKKLQAQLNQAQRLESIGRLAGGIAHDFNNMLGVILGRVELALETVKPDHPLRTDLDEILKAASRSAEITRQLLAFARKQPIHPVALNLNHTIEGMLRMIRRLIGEDIDLAWLPRTGLWPVKIDPSQVDQVLANLCVNARDAIHGVGKVTIETDRVVFDEDCRTGHANVLPGDYVMLAVSDDGCGMDRHTMDRIFEPFFTTKEAGRGTGLGLSTVHGIVTQNGGVIHFYSEPGKGTTCKIYLPRHPGEPCEPEPPRVGEIPSGRGERVLVAEDDDSILNMTARMLERLGYSVLKAGMPGEALRLVKEHPGEIHLLITDVIMPEMNGQDLAERCRAARPGMKCLFMSGYTASIIAHRGVIDKDGLSFIQKPFSMRELASRVREMLDDHPQPAARKDLSKESGGA